MDSSSPSHRFTSSPSFQSIRGPRKPLHGFTLLELLVVLTVISLLVALLLPALEKARETARLVQCAAQQRQIYQGAATYATDHDGKLPDRDGRAGYPSRSWTKPGTPVNPETGRDYAHGGRTNHNHMAEAAGDEFDTIGQFMERYLNIPLKPTLGGDHKRFKEMPNLFHCPSTPIPTDKMSGLNSYFLAGFGARQRESKHGWDTTAVGNRDYPAGYPRLPWFESVDDKQPGFLVDLFNHADPRHPRDGRGNLTAPDGSTRSFSYREGYVFAQTHAGAHADIYVPSDSLFVWDGQNEHSCYKEPLSWIRYQNPNGTTKLLHNSGQYRRFGYAATE